MYKYCLDFGSFRCTDPDCCLEVWGYAFDCPKCNFDGKLNEKFCSHPPESFSPMNDYDEFEKTKGQRVEISCPNCGSRFISNPFDGDIDDLVFYDQKD